MNTKASGSLLGGTLLVAGTTIGGGMLGLPILTGLGGFAPSLVVYFFCWLFMASTGLLLLEVCLWIKGESNIVTMAKKTLGKPGEFFAWGLYLFLFYCLTLAYIVGCGSIIADLLGSQIPQWLGCILFLLFFGPFVYWGPHVVGKLNFLLMAGLAVTFFTFVFLGSQYIDSKLLTYKNWSLSLIGLPISFAAFAYQGTIPTLAHYMQYDAKRIRTAIVVGSFIPLIAYVIWQSLILGIVPVEGPYGLQHAFQNGDNAVQALKHYIQNPLIFHLGQYFAFFALVTSFFGVTLGLLDFLADGLKIKKTPSGKLFLCFLVFIPPLIIGIIYPHVFLQALDYAGGFGCALLLGLLPILMVWVGRYRLGYPSVWTLPGGRVSLILLILFVLFELACEIFH